MVTDHKKSIISYGSNPKICNILKPNVYCVSNIYESIKTFDGIDAVDFDEPNWWFYSNLAGEGALLHGDVAIRSYPGKAFLRLKLPVRVVGFKKINDNFYFGTPFGLLEVKTDNSEYALYARKMPVEVFNGSLVNNLNNEIIIKDLLLEEKEKIFLAQKERSFLIFENDNGWSDSYLPYKGTNKIVKDGNIIYYFGCQAFGDEDSYESLEGGLSYYDKVKGEHVNISKNPVTKIEIVKEKIFYTVAKYLSSNDYDEIRIEFTDMEYDKTSGDNKRLTSKTMLYKFNNNQSDGIYAYPKSKEYKYDYKNSIERFIIIEKDGNKNFEPLKESKN